jgi:AcrR family transcriptional regulator
MNLYVDTVNSDWHRFFAGSPGKMALEETIMKAKPNPAKPARPADLKEACLIESLAIIDEKGLEALSLREVARRLGVSHQAPYRHFASREHILAELITRAVTLFADRLDQRERFDNPYEDLNSMGRAYMAYAAAHPLNYRLMFGAKLVDPTQYPSIMQAGQRAFGILKTAIARLDPSFDAHVEQHVELDALFTWATVHGAASLMQSHAVSLQKLPASTIASFQERALERVAQALELARRNKS